MLASLKPPLSWTTWRPAVLGVMVYVSLLAVLVVSILCVAPLAAFSDGFLEPRIFGFSIFQVWTAANVVWLALVAMELRPALRAPRILRHGQVCGVVAAFVVLVVVQVLAQSMKRCAEAWM